MDENFNININENINSLRKNLLDMGLRNNLLNFKEVSRTIPIIDENVAELFDILILNENKMEFLHKDTLNNEEDLIEENNDKQTNLWSMPTSDIIPDKHKDLFLQTSLTETELQKRLFSLNQYYKTSIEDQGYNNLFLALGFLEWKQTDNELEFHRAPIILIPVELIRESVGSPFKIKWSYDDISFNLSLQYKLLDQDINFPIPDEFETKEDIYTYFKNIKESISKKEDWNVTNDMYLSTFSFKKFVMYKDLDLDKWSSNVTTSEIGRLFGSKNPENYESFDENDVDKLIKPVDTYNVVDADSSQIAVIEDAKKGHSLVVEGPPGTGKSQTIVNLIAELLANNKTILFVSEKMAALDVVKKRMETIGLGDSCLELHSNKTNSKNLLKDLNNTLNKDTVSLNEYNDYQNLNNIRDELDTYMSVIQSKYGNTDLTIYDLIGIYEYKYQKLESLNQKIYKFSMPNLESCTNQEKGEMLGKIDEIANLYGLIQPIKNNPWNYTNPDNLSPDNIDNVKSKSEELKNNITEIIENLTIISENIGIKTVNTIKDIDEYIKNCSILITRPSIIKDEGKLLELITSLKQYQEKIKNINPNINNINLEATKRQVKQLNNDINSLSINKEILYNENILQLLKDFKENKENINNSQLQMALNDPNLIQKLIKVKSNKGSFFGKLISHDYKESKKGLESYYQGKEVTEDQMIQDYDQLINWNNKLINLRNQITAYTTTTLSDEKIILELEKLLSSYKTLNDIRIEISNINQSNPCDSIGDLENHINILIELNEIKNYLISNEELGKYYFNETWNGQKSDIIKIDEKYRNIEIFNDLYKSNYFDDSIINTLKDDSKNNDLKDKLNIIKQLKEDINIDYQYLNSILNFRDKLSTNNIEILNLNDFKISIENILNNITSLSDWNQFRSFCIKYQDEYTRDIINLIKEDKIHKDAIVPLFEFNFANNILIEIFKNSVLLRDFNSTIHEKNIEQFKQLDKEVINLNKYRVREILDKKRPDISMGINPKSELGILENEINKKRNFKAIRQLLTECPNVIRDIKPCFMMSPLSIAQYLDPKQYESYFDYVIFDEASQVKTEDAIGALLRGKNYVIMGDTKQLPPTSFFDVESNVDQTTDDYYSSIQDVESILHFCKTIFPDKMLKCHYRSRHESLIAVSNMEFYNNELYIYPSPMAKSDDLGLKFEYDPNTIYDRGKSGRNQKEAENIVNYALNHFQKYGNTKSLGIGTFSMSQKQAVLEELEIKLKENNELEKFFNETGENGFFVKNIENIQGDERDVILISIGYGYDINHKITMNFGPLNKEGGERRLNVLATRAREKCVVFSNFKSSDMVVSDKTPFGVKSLKTYLFYAETGEFPSNYDTGADFDSEFEKSVFNFLTDEGYPVAKQVGCAGYRIDLAIIDKNNSNKYILGIECDGAPYHSSPVARDRDRLRQQILEGLGWKFHRIWSTDWYHNRDNAKEILLKTVEDAIKYNENEERLKKFEKIEEEKSNQNNNEITTINKDEEDRNQEESITKQENNEKSSKEIKIPLNSTTEPVKTVKEQQETITTKTPIQQKTEAVTSNESSNPYESKVKFTKVEKQSVDNNEYQYYTKTVSCDNFYKQSPQDVTDIIKEIIDLEGPIYIDEINQRMKTVYNVKVTKKFKTAVKVLLEKMIQLKIIYSKDDFYYMIGKTEIVARKRTEPRIRFISDEEIEESIINALKLEYSLFDEDLAKSASIILGFKSLRASTKDKFLEIIKNMESKSKIKRNQQNKLELNS